MSRKSLKPTTTDVGLNSNNEDLSINDISIDPKSEDQDSPVRSSKNNPFFGQNPNNNTSYHPLDSANTSCITKDVDLTARNDEEEELVTKKKKIIEKKPFFNERGMKIMTEHLKNDMDNLCGMEDGLLTKVLHERVILIEMCCAVFAFIGILVAMQEHNEEVDLKEADSDYNMMTINCSAITAILNFLTNRARRTCKMYDVSCTYFFSTKCLFKMYPYKTLTFIIVLGIFVFAQAIRISESPMWRNLTPLQMKSSLGSWYNAIWLCWITMTTVGYGDFYPVTTTGRVVILIVSLWATFIVSLIVVAFSNELNFNLLETNVYDTLERLQKKEEMKAKAGKVIGNLVGYISTWKKKKKIEYNKIKNAKLGLLDFKVSSRQYRALKDEKYNVAEDLARHFYDLKDELYILKGYQENMFIKINEKLNRIMGVKTPQTNNKMKQRV